jgi:hypothetical protein
VPGNVIEHVENLTNDIKHTLRNLLQNEQPRKIRSHNPPRLKKSESSRGTIQLQAEDDDSDSVYQNAQENFSKNQQPESSAGLKKNHNMLSSKLINRSLINRVVSDQGKVRLLILGIEFNDRSYDNSKINLYFNEDYGKNINIKTSKEYRDNNNNNKLKLGYFKYLDIWESDKVMIDLYKEDKAIASFDIIVNPNTSGNPIKIEFNYNNDSKKEIGELTYKVILPSDFLQKIRDYYYSPKKTFSFSLLQIKGHTTYNYIKAIIYVEGRRQESDYIMIDQDSLENRRIVNGNYDFQFSYGTSTKGRIIFVENIDNRSTSFIHIATIDFNIQDGEHELNVNDKLKCIYKIRHSKLEKLSSRDKDLQKYSEDSFYISNIYGNIFKISNIISTPDFRLDPNVKHILRLFAGYEIREYPLTIGDNNTLNLADEIKFSYVPFVTEFTYYILYTNDNIHKNILGSGTTRFIEGTHNINVKDFENKYQPWTLSFDVNLPSTVYRMIPVIYHKRGIVEIRNIKNNGIEIEIILNVQEHFFIKKNKFMFMYDDKYTNKMLVMVRKIRRNENNVKIGEDIVIRKLILLRTMGYTITDESHGISFNIHMTIDKKN